MKLNFFQLRFRLCYFATWFSSVRHWLEARPFSDLSSKLHNHFNPEQTCSEWPSFFPITFGQEVVHVLCVELNCFYLCLWELWWVYFSFFVCDKDLSEHRCRHFDSWEIPFQPYVCLYEAVCTCQGGWIFVPGALVALLNIFSGTNNNHAVWSS